jgi:CheY-like chemotaxis protein
VVEDSEMEAIIVQTLVADLPLLDLVHIARDGVEAMAFLRCEAQRPQGQLPELILLDINMPRMNGFEVLKHLKADSAFRSIPVVMFTTSTSQDDIDLAYSEGANSYITKPACIADFRETLCRFADFWAKAARLPACSCDAATVN